MHATRNIQRTQFSRPKPFARSRAALLLIAALSAGVVEAAPQYLIVGDTQGGASHCQYATIQEALDAAYDSGPDLDYVFVTNTATYDGVALVVGDQSVLIEGGYDDCDLSVIGPRATIVGDQANSVIDVQTGGSAAREITLRHLDLSSGDASFGGGVYIFGNSLAPPYVLIEDVFVHDNKATYGGGIASAFATLAIGKDVTILGNTARRAGGGLYLQGGTVRIQNDRTAISGNHAQVDAGFQPSGQGGGIYATGSPAAPLDVSVGAWQYQVGDPRPPISGFFVSNNRADDRGGGIFLNGANVQFLAFETTVLGNSAANSGGGISIYNGGTLQMSRNFPGAPAAPQCERYLLCNVIRSNSVDAHANYVAAGGGISVQVGTVRLLQTALLENIADAASAIDTGSINGAAAPPNTLRLQGVLASRNQCRGPTPQRTCSTIDLGAGADARISYSTFADNIQLPGTYASEIYAYGPATSSLKLFSSIFITDPGFYVPTVFTGVASYQTDCVITNNNGLPPGATRSQVAVPGFNNPAVYDYRLRSESLATDFCDNANTPSDDFTDLALYPRGLDDVRRADLYGHFDVGAFESDHIFGGRYE
jgi:hypothetical protein